ncbi:MAG TPA: adenylate/guanylate cyclase domain-containing protein [Nevskia sp.]|nr:adenylate/guanylate cyclase domain-containing protein [Nevskia sp.]
MRAGLLVALALVLLEFAAFRTLGASDHHVQDWLLRIHAQARTPDPDIVLLNIDERSFAAMSPDFGAYPWPRSVYAELVEKLERQRPAAIVFDQFFSDPLREHADEDAYFSEVAAAAPNVYFAMVWLEGVPAEKGLPLEQYGEALGFRRTAAAAAGTRLPLLLPFEGLARTGRIGLTNFLSDDDGIGRRYWADFQYQGWRVPSLPLRVAKGLGWALPAGPDVEINWRGLPQTRTSYSFSDVFLDLEKRQPQRPPDEFRGKIVIVGSTAIGIPDLHQTPLAHSQTGPEILAAALETIKHGDALRRPPPWSALVAGLLLLALFALAHWRGAGLFALGVSLAVLSPLLLLVGYGALQAGWIIPLVPPLGALWAAYLGLALREYLNERQERGRREAFLRRFLHPGVVQALLASKSDPFSQKPQSLPLTLLFSDIRGFTTFSETRPPEVVVNMLNRYFSRQVAVVFKHGGTVDKFIGDAIMAFWGAPLPDERQAEHAVAAALEMSQVVQAFAAEMRAEGVEDFDVGIGIHSGPAVVAFMGSENKTDYTAIGDTVNLASRIEGLTKGVARVLVSAETRAACGPERQFIDRGEFKVKGRAQPVRLYEPVPGPDTGTGSN